MLYVRLRLATKSRRSSNDWQSYDCRT